MALAVCAASCLALGLATREKHEFRIEFGGGSINFVHGHNVYQEAFVPPLLEAEWWRTQDGTGRFFVRIGERTAEDYIHTDMVSAPWWFWSFLLLFVVAAAVRRRLVLDARGRGTARVWWSIPAPRVAILATFLLACTSILGVIISGDLFIEVQARDSMMEVNYYPEVEAKYSPHKVEWHSWGRFWIYYGERGPVDNSCLTPEPPEYSDTIGFAAKYPALLFAVITAVQLTRGPIRRFWRRRRNLCPLCAYDLAGNVSGICPECAEPFDLGSVARVRPL